MLIACIIVVNVCFSSRVCKIRQSQTVDWETETGFREILRRAMKETKATTARRIGIYLAAFAYHELTLFIICT